MYSNLLGSQLFLQIGFLNDFGLKKKRVENCCHKLSLMRSILKSTELSFPKYVTKIKKHVQVILNASSYLLFYFFDPSFKQWLHTMIMESLGCFHSDSEIINRAFSLV